MSVDDLGDELAELRELKRRVDRLESGTMLENASITRGRVRFIGGTLRVDSGGRVEIVGTLDLEGPWTFSGDGDITGDVDLDGTMSVRNGEIVIDGANPITLASDTSGGAAIMFDGGGSLASGGTSIVLRAGDGSLVGLGGASILLQADAIDVGALPSLPNDIAAQYVVVGEDGLLYSSSGVGGGGGAPTPGEDLGNFQWPFDLSTVTSEYGPRTTPYTGFHEGIDFGIAPAVAGAPIIAAGDGTVAVSTFASGWGNHVRITHSISAGDVSTLYAHMNATPLVGVGDTVSKGDVIGYVGNTGNSFGAHLHFETWMSTSYGSHVNPRDFMAAYGPV